jgi:hypothetical protein
MNLTPTSNRIIKAHDKPCAAMSVHIKKHVVATGGDDAMFKIYNMNNYEELANGLGHSV